MGEFLLGDTHSFSHYRATKTVMVGLQSCTKIYNTCILLLPICFSLVSNTFLNFPRLIVLPKNIFNCEGDCITCLKLITHVNILPIWSFNCWLCFYTRYSREKFMELVQIPIRNIHCSQYLMFYIYYIKFCF